MIIAKLVKGVEEQLHVGGVVNCTQEARWLVNFQLGLPYSAICYGEDKDISAVNLLQLDGLVSRRVSGEPLQYILGSCEFYGLELKVGAGVLIPRPETERLVDFARELYRDGDICDLCTGSGAVALALASLLGAAVRVVGVDISEVALEFAVVNAKNLGLSNVNFMLGNLFANIPAGSLFSLITANPPYVSSAEYDVLPKEVKVYEPKVALYADEGGLGLIRAIARGARGYLLADGWLICEFGCEHGSAATKIFMEYGYKNIQVLQDYTGRDRFIKAQKNGAC